MIAYTDLISACGPILISKLDSKNNTNSNSNSNNNNVFKKYTDSNINLDLLFDSNEIVINNDNNNNDDDDDDESIKDKFIIELFNIINNFKFENENNGENYVEEKENLENIQEIEKKIK